MVHDDDIESLVKELRRLYESYAMLKTTTGKDEEERFNLDNEENEEIINNDNIHLPTENLLEYLSVNLQINPISLYWLLMAGTRNHGWYSIYVQRRLTQDIFSTIVLRVLGHRWPNQIDKKTKNWVNEDGIVPLTKDGTEKTLLEYVHEAIVDEFPNGNITLVEQEFEDIMGIDLSRWLADMFFKHHTTQFRKRPVAWQLQSRPNIKATGRWEKSYPAFSCLIYYHKLDLDLIPKIRSQYISSLIVRKETELSTLDKISNPTSLQSTRKIQLENSIAELKSFDKKLDSIFQQGFGFRDLAKTLEDEDLDVWCSSGPDMDLHKDHQSFVLQEQKYQPDINNGIRV